MEHGVNSFEQRGSETILTPDNPERPSDLVTMRDSISSEVEEISSNALIDTDSMLDRFSQSTGEQVPTSIRQTVYDRIHAVRDWALQALMHVSERQGEPLAVSPQGITRRDFLRQMPALGVLVALSPGALLENGQTIVTEEREEQFSEINNEDIDKLRDDPQGFAYESYENYLKYVRFQNIRYNEYQAELFDLGLNEESRRLWREYVQAESNFYEDGHLIGHKVSSDQYLKPLSKFYDSLSYLSDSQRRDALAQVDNLSVLHARIKEFEHLRPEDRILLYKESKDSVVRIRKDSEEQREWLIGLVSSDSYQKRMEQEGNVEGDIGTYISRIKKTKVLVADMFYNRYVSETTAGQAFPEELTELFYVPKDMRGSIVLNPVHMSSAHANKQVNSIIVHEFAHMMHFSDISAKAQVLNNRQDVEHPHPRVFQDVFSINEELNRTATLRREDGFEYLGTQQEFFARRLALIYELETLGIWQYRDGGDFTDEHMISIRNNEHHLSPQSKLFITMYRDALPDILNTIASNDEVRESNYSEGEGKA